ncbi:hypothetical protein BS17DRAFT_205950 [Gyrodon lividus]|nr:hypothetical protein BS17DRAFT_205950 [Gyrodon lividus]
MWFYCAQFLLICGLLLGWASLAAADYYVDNANLSVLYSSSSMANWQTFSFDTRNVTLLLGNANVTVDSSECYDQNYILAACTTSDGCQISIPFTGSGITVYILNAGFQGVSANLSVDGGQAVTTTIAAPSEPSYQTPNVSLFSVQSLPSTEHNAKLNILDWNTGATSLYFDYALINESYVGFPIAFSSFSATSTTSSASASSSVQRNSTSAPTTTPLATVSTTSVRITTLIGTTYTPTASPTTTLVSHAGTSVNLGVVIGSACGGLAAIAALLAAVILLKKRKSKFVKIEDAQKPHPYPSASAHSAPPAPLSPPPQVGGKKRLRLTYHDAALSRAHTPAEACDDDSSDFQFLPSIVAAGRVPTVRSSLVTLTPSIEARLPDDSIIDVRRQDGGPSSRLTGSRATMTSVAAPSGYQIHSPTLVDT